jgi:hypothetical protein
MNQPDWSTLNAYVDGALEPAAAAAVADAAGADPRIAEQIALLYQLKGASHGAMPDAPAELAGALARCRSKPLLALAAVAATVFLVGTAIAVGLYRMHTPALSEDLLATARTLHEKWEEADRHRPADAPPAAVLAALSGFGQMPFVPDLESTELTIGHITVSKGPAGRVLQIGYRGNHGCHLSLFVLTHARLPEMRVRVAMGRERAYGWRVHDLGYLLFAEGMDESRLTLIADKVEQATRSRAPLDRQAEEQLAENKRESAPCRA